MKEILKRKLLNEFSTLSGSELNVSYTNKWVKKIYSNYVKLNKITNEFLLEEHADIKRLVLEHFKVSIIPSKLEMDDYSIYFDLLSSFKNSVNYDIDILLSEYFTNVNFLSNFQRFEELFPEEYQLFIEKEEFAGNFYELMDEEANNADEDNLEETLDEIKSICDDFGFDSTDVERTIEKKIQRRGAREEDSFDWNDDVRPSGHQIGPYDENKEIKNIFDSLKDSFEK